MYVSLTEPAVPYLGNGLFISPLHRLPDVHVYLRFCDREYFQQVPIPIPRQIRPLAPPRQHFIQCHFNEAAELNNAFYVSGYAVVSVVPYELLVKPLDGFGQLPVHVLLQPCLNYLLLNSQFLIARAVHYPVLPRPCLTVDVRESKKVESLCSI